MVTFDISLDFNIIAKREIAMVRFKNRYILADYSNLITAEPLTERGLLKLLKETVEEMMGQLFLAKVTYSLQIKYMNQGRVIIRVPRDHATELQACLFIIKGVKVMHVSGVIRGMQKKLFEVLRRELHRELTAGETDMINKIDYA
jgi:RNase P/RNase MRP subunit POP5